MDRMDEEALVRKFLAMGARLKVGDLHGEARSRSRRVVDPASRVTMDIGNDADGEYFELKLRGRDDLFVDVLDLDKDLAHLLLMVKPLDLPKAEKQKYLCGHDERAWFVAAVPEKAAAKDIPEAMEALKPPEARWAQERSGVKAKDRNRRRNKGFVRQGEWFFVPVPNLVVDKKLWLRNEPLSRGVGKPHLAQYLYRSGGELIYVSRKFFMGLTQAQFERELRRNPGSAELFETRRRNMAVFVRGKISHADHQTIALDCWHQVLMNTEHQALAARHVVFID